MLLFDCTLDGAQLTDDMKGGDFFAYMNRNGVIEAITSIFVKVRVSVVANPPIAL